MNILQGTYMQELKLIHNVREKEYVRFLAQEQRAKEKRHVRKGRRQNAEDREKG